MYRIIPATTTRNNQKATLISTNLFDFVDMWEQIVVSHGYFCLIKSNCSLQVIYAFTYVYPFIPCKSVKWEFIPDQNL